MIAENKKLKKSVKKFAERFYFDYRISVEGDFIEFMSRYFSIILQRKNVIITTNDSDDVHTKIFDTHFLRDLKKIQKKLVKSLTDGFCL